MGKSAKLIGLVQTNWILSFMQGRNVCRWKYPLDRCRWQAASGLAPILPMECHFVTDSAQTLHTQPKCARRNCVCWTLKTQPAKPNYHVPICEQVYDILDQAFPFYHFTLLLPHFFSLPLSLGVAQWHNWWSHCLMSPETPVRSRHWVLPVWSLHILPMTTWVSHSVLLQQIMSAAETLASMSLPAAGSAIQWGHGWPFTVPFSITHGSLDI